MEYKLPVLRVQPAGNWSIRHPLEHTWLVKHAKLCWLTGELSALCGLGQLDQSTADNYTIGLKIVATCNFCNHNLLLYICNYLWALFVLSLAFEFPGNSEVYKIGLFVCTTRREIDSLGKVETKEKTGPVC